MFKTALTATWFVFLILSGCTKESTFSDSSIPDQGFSVVIEGPFEGSGSSTTLNDCTVQLRGDNGAVVSTSCEDTALGEGESCTVDITSSDLDTLVEAFEGGEIDSMFMAVTCDHSRVGAINGIDMITNDARLPVETTTCGIAAELNWVWGDRPDSEYNAFRCVR